MAGTYIVSTTFMTGATGGTVLVSVPPVIGCTLLGPNAGGVHIPFASNGYIYLDGSLTPTNLADLPVGFKPDDAFSLDYYTVISTAGDSAIYTIPLTPPQIVTITALNPTGIWLQYPMTGMVSLSALAGATLSVAMVSAPAGLVVIQNLDNTGNWDTGMPPTYGVGLSGTYTTVAPPVPTLTGIAPTSGPVAGGTTVTVAGTGFLAVTGVTVGGVTVAFTLVSPTRLTFVTPAHAAGPVTVTLGGVSLSAVFTYAVTGTKLPPIPRLR